MNEKGFVIIGVVGLLIIAGVVYAATKAPSYQGFDSMKYHRQ